MIECSDEKINYTCKKQCKNKRRIKKLPVFLAILFFVSLFAYFKVFVYKQIITVCDVYSQSVITESINSAVMSSFIDSVNYNDLVTIEKNNNGDIVLINTDSYKINALSRTVSTKIENVVKEKLKLGVPIPLLAFTGIRTLSGYGKKINFKTLSFGDVNCFFNSKFTGMGINQTMHSIYCDFEVKINVLFMFNNKEIVNHSSVLITESVLVGKVPDFYLTRGLNFQ